VVDPGVARHEADPRPDLGRLGQHVVSGHRGHAARRREDRAQDSQAGRLSGTVGPQEPENLAGANVERNVAQSDDAAAAKVAETLREMVDVNHRGFARQLACEIVWFFRVYSSVPSARQARVLINGEHTLRRGKLRGLRPSTRLGTRSRGVESTGRLNLSA